MSRRYQLFLPPKLPEKQKILQVHFLRPACQKVHNYAKEKGVMKRRKRLVSMLLACCLLITLFPTIGFASEITSQAAICLRTVRL